MQNRCRVECPRRDDEHQRQHILLILMISENEGASAGGTSGRPGAGRERDTFSPQAGLSPPKTPCPCPCEKEKEEEKSQPVPRETPLLRLQRNISPPQPHRRRLRSPTSLLLCCRALSVPSEQSECAPCDRKRPKYTLGASVALHAAAEIRLTFRVPSASSWQQSA